MDRSITSPRPNDSSSSQNATASGSLASVASAVESIVGCKWSVQVLGAIRRGIHRPGALERSCLGISTKVLNERLRKLQDFGLLRRLVYPEIPPRVEYHFTPYGQQFIGLLDQIERLQQQLDQGTLSSAEGMPEVPGYASGSDEPPEPAPQEGHTQDQSKGASGRGGS